MGRCMGEWTFRTPCIRLQIFFFQNVIDVCSIFTCIIASFNVLVFLTLWGMMFQGTETLPKWIFSLLQQDAITDATVNRERDKERKNRSTLYNLSRVGTRNLQSLANHLVLCVLAMWHGKWKTWVHSYCVLMLRILVCSHLSKG